MDPFERTLIKYIESVERKRLNPELDASQLKELIDVSLATGDKEWFMDLTSRLSEVQNA
ncbi:IDEAL domain-containing protein [Cytobacillus sp.]|uniref:IDEAL domain-containing protein n=1 Tax=Cytobacillus sp. TaxID=2675269 RepID=UPI003513B523